MTYFVAAAAAFALFAVLGVVVISRVRPYWSAKRSCIVAALPLPGALLLFAIWVTVKSVATPAADCGVDACGMAIVVAMGIAGLAAIGFALSVTVAWYTRRRIRA